VNARRWAAAAVLGPALIAGDAAAQGTTREPEEPHGAENPNGIDPLRGSIFLFDQSLSTQTAHLEPQPQQSYVPFYGWWLSLRPRWSFTPRFRVQARLDFYKEFTNSQPTTYRDENVFDDLWTDAVYTAPVAESGRWSHTTWTLGARAQWPTSKASQGAGIYVTLGAFAGVAQDLRVLPDRFPVFRTARLGLRFGYLHAFSNAQTPTSYGNYGYLRQDTDEHSFVSDQISGQTLVAHQFYALAEGAVRITPKLELGLSLVWIDQWHYPPPPATVATGTGPYQVPRNGDEQFTQLIWDVVSLEYDLFPEVTLGLGYYNLTNSIAPDGQVRSPFAGGQDSAFWSPDARIFFDITANLDTIFEDATGRARWGQGEGAAAARSARAQSIAAQNARYWR
jgi:hypothetical protein